MKMHRLVTLGLAAYAGWKRLSPQQKASAKRHVTRLTRRPVRAADRSVQC